MDRLIPQAEWESYERYQRFMSHAECCEYNAYAVGDKALMERNIAAAGRWLKRAQEEEQKYLKLVKERESK